MTPETAAAYSLLNAQAVRDRAHRMLALGLDDKLPNFRVDLDRLDDAVDLVMAVMQKNYPTLDVPFHSRWRHFVTTVSIAMRTLPKISRIQSRGRARTSILPSSASCSTPAPARNGATAIR